MDRELATRLMCVLPDVGRPLNEAAQLIEEISDEAEKLKFKRAIGEIMAKLFTDLMLDIIGQYPELDPDKDTEWLQNLQKQKRNAADQQGRPSKR